jgi:putative exosortase-associated protein (TIGR04073 family)
MRAHGTVFRLATSLLALALASACSWTSPQPNYVSKADDYQNRVSRKVGRGLTNVMAAPLEVPNQMVDMASEGDNNMEYAAGYVGGLFVGVGYTVGRMLSGGFDLITAPISYPTVNGMDPEMAHSDFFDSVLDGKGRFAQPRPVATLAAAPEATAAPEDASAPVTEAPRAAPEPAPAIRSNVPQAVTPQTPAQSAPAPAAKPAPKFTDKTLDDL